MSQIIQNKVLGLEWPIECPSTLAEVVTACGGSEAAAVKLVNNQILYHVVNTDIREDFVAALVESTKIPVLTKVVGKKKDGTEIVKDDESAEKYVERVLALTGKQITDFTAERDAVLAAKNEDGTPRIIYDATPHERKAPQPKTPSKGDNATAANLVKAGGDTLAKVVTMLSSYLNETVDGTSEPALALAIMRYRQAEEAKARAAVAQAFALPA